MLVVLCFDFEHAYNKNKWIGENDNFEFGVPSFVCIACFNNLTNMWHREKRKKKKNKNKKANNSNLISTVKQRPLLQTNLLTIVLFLWLWRSN